MKKIVAIVMIYLISVFPLFSLPIDNDDFVFISNTEAQIAKEINYFYTDYNSTLYARNGNLEIKCDLINNTIKYFWNNQFLFSQEIQPTSDGFILYFEKGNNFAQATFKLNDSGDSLILVDSNGLESFYNSLSNSQIIAIQNCSNFVRDYVLQQKKYKKKTKKLTAACKSALVGVGLSLIGAAVGCAAGGIGCAIGIAYHWKAIVDAGVACN